MIHLKIMSAGVLAALFVGGVARADEPDFYLGAGAGQARQTSRDFEGSDTSFRVLGGLSFNSYLAAEAGYIDGGEQTDRQGSLKLAVKSDGFFVAGLAKIPLGKYVAPYVKLGYVVYDSTTTVSSANFRTTEYLHDKDLLYGAGLELKFGDNLRVRTEYEQVDVPDSDFDIFSLVVAFQF